MKGVIALTFEELIEVIVHYALWRFHFLAEQLYRAKFVVIGAGCTGPERPHDAFEIETAAGI